MTDELKSLRITQKTWKKLQIIKYNEELNDLSSVIELLLKESHR